MKKIITLFVALSVYVTLAAASTDSIKVVLQAINQSLEEKDVTILEPHFAQNFSLGTASLPLAEKFLNNIYQNVKIKSFELVETDENQPKVAPYLLHVETVLSDDKKSTSYIGLDTEYKILFVDFYDKQYSGSRFSVSKLRTTIPFLLNETGIMLSVKVNDSDKPLNFIFDTGANGLALTKEMAKELSVGTDRHQQSEAVGGIIKTSISENNKLTFEGGYEIKDQNIAIVPHLGEGIDGIVGLNLTRTNIVKINQDKKQLELYSYGDYEDEQEFMTIKCPDALIDVPMSLNIRGRKDVQGNFILDTGANYKAIAFEKFVRKNRLLLTGFVVESEGSTESLGVLSHVYNGKVKTFQIGDKIIVNDMDITLQGSTGSSNDREIPDGSLGIQLLKNYNITIDLLRKRLWLVPIQ